MSRMLQLSPRRSRPSTTSLSRQTWRAHSAGRATPRRYYLRRSLPWIQPAHRRAYGPSCTNHHHCLPPGVTEYASLYSIQPPTHPPPNLLQVALAPVTVELWSLPSWSCNTPPCRNDAHLNGSLGAPLHTLRVHSVTADSLGGSGGEAQLPPWALTLTPTLILI